jgi:hypothetical protein
MAQDPQKSAPKRYVCIGYFDREAMDRVPPTELQGILAKCSPHMASLYASKAVVLDAGLSNQSWWLQRMNSAVRTTDGPFTEAKECVGSVVLIEASSDEEALRIAKLHPTTQIAEGEHLGWRMEVRPVHYFHATYPAVGSATSEA